MAQPHGSPHWQVAWGEPGWAAGQSNARPAPWPHRPIGDFCPNGHGPSSVVAVVCFEGVNQDT